MPARNKTPSRRARPQPPLQERKQQFVRQAIRNAALDLFLEQGYEAARVEDIAARAGVSRRTFFRYFASKDDLLAQGIDEFREVVRRALDSCPAGRPVIELFRTTVVQAASEAASDPRARDYMRILRASPGARAAQLSRIPAIEELLEEAFLRRVKGGRAQEAAAGVLARMTLAAVGAAMSVWCEDGEADIAAAARAVLDALEHLLRPGPGKGSAGRTAAATRFL